MSATGYIITIPVEGPISAQRIVDSTHTLDPLQAVVNGPIEIVPYLGQIDLTPLLHDGLESGVAKMVSIGWRPCVAFCNEEGKLDGMPYNETATRLWLTSLIKAGHIKAPVEGKVAMNDVLVGPIAVCIGDPEILDAL